jgi:prefoldin subunit 5
MNKEKLEKAISKVWNAKELVEEMSSEETENLVIADDIKSDRSEIELMENNRYELDDIVAELDGLYDRLTALKEADK